MEEEKKKKLEKQKKRMEVVNKWRLGLMFIAVLLLLFLFWGGKVWEEAAWFINIRQKFYHFLLYDIFVIVILTFSRLFLTMRYNHMVKKL